MNEPPLIAYMAIIYVVAVINIGCINAYRDKAHNLKDDTSVIDLGSGVLMEFVRVSSGEYGMGSPSDEQWRQQDETIHIVTLTNTFMISKYEVTQDQYKAVTGTNPSRFKGNNKPVDSVSWYDAVRFCKHASDKYGKRMRLPTEAEWEYACRASTRSAYYTGNMVSDLARAGWFIENSGESTRMVGQLEPNQYGLYDMHGNVWEWCSDWYAAYPHNPTINPIGPKHGQQRIIRGGCWHSSHDMCRSASRESIDPRARLGIIGFRVLIEID